MMVGCLVLLLVGCADAAAPAVETIGQPTSIPRFGIFEQSFSKSGNYANPWEQVRVSMTLTAPSGQRTTVGGFYYASTLWKARYSPSELGTWSWQATIGDSASSAQSSGVFSVVASEAAGFVRSNPNNHFRWIFDDGTPYSPLGIGDCVLASGSRGPLDSWGLDGGFRPPDPGQGRLVDIDTYLAAYRAAGVNLFRWSVDNCAFGLQQSIQPSGNLYLPENGVYGDQLVAKLRQYGFRTYMVLFNAPPFASNPSPAQLDAIKRYVKYVVDRYGASVDFWELMNESSVSDSWYAAIIPYLRSIDPYRHPISTSDERPNVAGIEIDSPHWYGRENEFVSDQDTWNRFQSWKASGKPVIVGEQGNQVQNWDARSGVRLRLRSWTAFFAEGTLIFWNTSFAKDYVNAAAANVYLGPEERGYLKVLQDFTRGFDSRAAIAALPVDVAGRVRGYALSGPAMYAAYLHAYTEHVTPTAGISVTVTPQVAGLASWTEPSTGRVLATQQLPAGRQTIVVPTFTTDIALKIQ